MAVAPMTEAEKAQPVSWVENDRIFVRLARPITDVDGEELRILRFDIPRAKHLRGAPGSDGSEADLVLHLIEVCGRLRRDVVDRLSIPDVGRCGEALSPFL